MTVNGAGNALSWAPAPAAGLTVGSTQIASGTTGSILIQTGTTLQEITMGSGVAAALVNGTNAAGGFLVANPSGVLPIAQGGTGQSTAATAINALLPTQTLNPGEFLTTDGTNVSWASVTTAPAGATTQVQYNNAGAFGANGGFTYDGTGVISLGVASSASGEIKLYDGGSATPVTISAGTATTAWTFNLPTSGGTNKYALTTDGTGVSSWSQIDLAAAVTGTLPVANGGTGLTSAGASGNALVSDGTNWTSGVPSKATNLAGGAIGEIPYQTAAGTTAFLAVGTAGQVLQSNAGAAPSWVDGDITIGTTTVALGAAQTTFTGVDEIVVTTDTANTMGLVTKSYVDAITSPIVRLSPAECATTADIGPTPFSGTPTIDGYATGATDRVLVKNQTLSENDGVYVIGPGPGFAWTRASDADQPAELTAATCFVLNGTANANTSWIQTLPVATIGTDPQNWTIQSALASYTGGTGISVVGNTITNTGVTSLDVSALGFTPAGVNTGAVVLGGTLAVSHGGTGLTALGTGVAAALGQPANAANGFVIQSATGAISASSVILNGSTSGTITLAAPAVAGTSTITFPVGGGASGQVLQTDGSGNLSWASVGTGSVTSITLSAGSTGLTVNGAASATITTSGTFTLAGTLDVDNGGTGLATGTSGGIPYFSAATTMASSALLAANNLMIGGGAGAAPSTTATGTGVITALGNNLNSANGLVGYNGTLGTTTQIAGGTSGTLTLQAQANASGTLTLPNGNGTILASSAALTTGSILFAGASGVISENNAQFFWDNTNKTIKIGQASTASGKITLFESTSANGVTIASGANTAAWTMTLPVDDGTSGQALVTNGSGVTSWASVSGTPGGATTNVQFNNAGAFGGNANFTYNSTGVITLGSVSATTGAIKLANTGSANLLTIEPGVNAAAWTFTFPTGPGTSGQVLQTDGAGAASWTTVTTTPAGANTQVQYNNSGAFGANGGFTYNGTNGIALGVASTQTGQVTLYNSTNANTAKIQSGANSANWTMTLPTSGGSANQVLVTDGTGVTSWATNAALAVADDVSTNSDEYPLFTASVSGNINTGYVSSTKFTYNPSTGQLTAKNMASSQGIHLNANAITANYTLPANYNGMSAGPISVAAGVTVTVGAGSSWSVV